MGRPAARRRAPAVRERRATRAGGVALLLIREARSDDIPELSALAARTWADAFGETVGVENLAAELEATRSEHYFEDALRTATILVAEEAGALVGYVELGDVQIPEVDVEPGDASVHRLYVETELQGRGVGRALMDAAFAHPRLAGARRIFLQVWEENRRAVALYESLGFRTIGTTEVTIGIAEVGEDLVMVREAERAST